MRARLPLNIPVVMQEESNWCWAACVSMITSYLGAWEDPQCNMANWLFNQTRCCDNPKSADCNRGGPTYKIATILKRYSINSRLVGRPITFDELEDQIEMGSPVLASWKMAEGGHNFLIVGVGNTDEKGVTINDPQAGRVTLPYSRLLDASGLGEWDYTWKDIGLM